MAQPQPLKPPPPNYEYEESPPIITYGSPPPMRLPEMNFNRADYFYFDDVEGWSFFPRHELRYIIKHPEEETAFAGQKNQDGIYEVRNLKTVVGHLPNRLDLVVLPDGFQVLLNHLIDAIDEESDDIIPLFARWILDPRPVIPLSGKIYMLRDEPVDVVVCTFTDAVHVFQVMAPFTEINLNLYMLKHYENPIRTYKATTAFVAGKSKGDSEPFPAHMPLLIWNIRGAGRPSFIENFKKLVALHEPKVIVLMETRVCHHQFKSLIPELGTEYRWGSVEGVGISGGAIILWDESLVDFEVITASRGLDLSLYGRFKMKARLIGKKRSFAS